jgi:organic radical activating enzyme
MKIKVSELFGPTGVVQGEGYYLGVPSIFVRTFGCNFTCQGFGMEKGCKSSEADNVAKSVHLYKKYEDLPLVHTGCDSYPSWHTAFKDLSPTYETTELANKIKAQLENGKFNYGTGKVIHLILTGGEPLLGWQRAYIELLEQLPDLKFLTFETNGTQKLHTALVDYFNKRNDLEVTFSVSPKLSASGEKWEDAIRPEVFDTFRKVNNSIIYTKFVVDKKEDFEEVDKAVEILGVNRGVFIMPVGGCLEEYNINAVKICDICTEKGYRFTPRLHVSLYGNGWAK